MGFTNWEQVTPPASTPTTQEQYLHILNKYAEGLSPMKIKHTEMADGFYVPSDKIRKAIKIMEEIEAACVALAQSGSAPTTLTPFKNAINTQFSVANVVVNKVIDKILEVGTADGTLAAYLAAVQGA
jgi:hypothetical protein